jgi:alpha-D-ribose 1-methylphosphonate 5-triphosphate diphosphatase
VPGALVLAAFQLPALAGITLPESIRMVSATPARAAYLSDRGEIAPRKRADLVRVRMHGDMPVVRGVWRQGQRVS